MRFKRFSTFLGALLVTAGLAGCGSLATKTLPVVLEQRTETFSVRLETPARFVLLEATPAGVRCDAKRTELSLEARGGGHRGAVVTVPSCSLVPKHAGVRSKDLFAKGEYVVRVAGSGRRPPRLTLDPEDPDALSGPDQDFAGATELAENGTLQGTVNFAGANATNWVALAAAKGAVSLLFLPEPGGDVEARLFVLPPGATTPVRLGTLLPKQKKTLTPDGGTLYVRLVGRRFSGAAPYALVRKDVAKVKATSLSVIDVYPVDGKSSLLLLPAHEGLKPEASLRVTGVRDGKAVSLGRCTVTSASPTQAGCRLDAVPAANVTKLRAEWVQESNAG
jgi:hypothetical protein